MLKLSNIKKYFSTSQGFLGKTNAIIKAVDGVDLTISSGENLSLVGESGCGKTTLARIIMRLERQDSGQVFFDGKDISGLKGKQLQGFRKNIQMVFQDPYSSLDPRFTIKRILEESFVLFGPTAKKDEKYKAMWEVIEAVGLSVDILERYPHEFSGGERQRIAIARALLVKPKLLILDEAVSSLDVLIQKQIIELLKSLQKKYDLTFLFISHNLKVVKALSQEIAVMYKGKIVELAPTEEIFHNSLHLYTQKLLKAALDFKVSTEEDGLIEGGKLTEEKPGHYVLR